VAHQTEATQKGACYHSEETQLRAAASLSNKEYVSKTNLEFQSLKYTFLPHRGAPCQGIGGPVREAEKRGKAQQTPGKAPQEERRQGP